MICRWPLRPDNRPRDEREVDIRTLKNLHFRKFFLKTGVGKFMTLSHEASAVFN